jgi:transglutaminase-like putative cysteine protease
VLRHEATTLVPDATEDTDEQAPGDLPDEVLIYTLPSRFCLPDLLGDEAWSRFGAIPAGYPRVQAICDYVHSHLTFSYGSSTAWSTAVDVNTTGFGVCRDFTHLAISFCRALNIPARYVFGYLPDMDVPPDAAPMDNAPMDFAAWMQVWLGERWWIFDPRNNRRRKGLIVMGQDATPPTWPWSPPSAPQPCNPCRCTPPKNQVDDNHIPPGNTRRADLTSGRMTAMWWVACHACRSIKPAAQPWIVVPLKARRRTNRRR